MPCVTSSTASYERVIGLMNSPYIPHHANWNVPADANLITLYGLTVSGKYDEKGDPKNPKLIITIHCAKSTSPKGYPFTLDEVLEKVKASVKLNLNTEEIVVLPKIPNKGDQAVAPNP